MGSKYRCMEHVCHGESMSLFVAPPPVVKPTSLFFPLLPILSNVYINMFVLSH